MISIEDKGGKEVYISNRECGGEQSYVTNVLKGYYKLYTNTSYHFEVRGERLKLKKEAKGGFKRKEFFMKPGMHELGPIPPTISKNEVIQPL